MFLRSSNLISWRRAFTVTLLFALSKMVVNLEDEVDEDEDEDDDVKGLTTQDSAFTADAKDQAATAVSVLHAGTECWVFCRCWFDLTT